MHYRPGRTGIHCAADEERGVKRHEGVAGQDGVADEERGVKAAVSLMHENISIMSRIRRCTTLEMAFFRPQVV